VDFTALVTMMVDADLARLSTEPRHIANASTW